MVVILNVICWTELNITRIHSILGLVRTNAFSFKNAYI